MFVLVQNNRAHELFAAAPVLHPDLLVVETDQPVEPGWLWDGSAFAPPPPEIVDMAAVRATAYAAIDAAAETARLRYVTPGSAQAMVYLAKEDEAERYLTDPAPDPARYRLLTAEVGITAPDLAGVAAAVAGLAAQWRQAAAGIEAIRLAAKQAVSAAETEAEVYAIMSTLAYP